MARPKRKHESGAATNYITRTKALKKLQLTLKDFRRLCILKGIYPHEPLHKKKISKGSTENKTFYYVKDINFLASEPIINKFREYKIFIRRMTTARAKGEKKKVDQLYANKPDYTLQHIVKERYPTFVSAIRDLDDALSLCFLFATFPYSKVVKPVLVHRCRQLTTEFMHYIIAARALRKVFVSIKGLYYQAEVNGEKVTWIVPHDRGHSPSVDVDISIISTFVEFYSAALGFVNFRLFTTVGLRYPPLLEDKQMDVQKSGEHQEEDDKESVSSLARPLARSADVSIIDEQDSLPDEFPTDEGHSSTIGESLQLEWESLKHLRHLFESCRFFLNREVPKESLTFIIRSCGGLVSWKNGPGASYEENDPRITHQVVDRPSNDDKRTVSRLFVQPQWIFDSFNSRHLLPIERYFPGATLPPHLSPFVKEKPGDYVPSERLEQLVQEGQDVAGLLEEKQVDKSRKKDGRKLGHKMMEKKNNDEKLSMAVERGKIHRENIQKLLNERGQELKMRELMIPKKQKRVYNKIKRGRKRHLKETAILKEKRKRIIEI